MPDWLRSELGLCLPQNWVTQAHAMFKGWFVRIANTGPGSGPAVAIEDVQDAVLEAAAASQASSLRDAIFLRFFRDVKVSVLDLKMSDEIVDAILEALPQTESGGNSKTDSGRNLTASEQITIYVAQQNVSRMMNL